MPIARFAVHHLTFETILSSATQRSSLSLTVTFISFAIYHVTIFFLTVHDSFTLSFKAQSQNLGCSINHFYSIVDYTSQTLDVAVMFVLVLVSPFVNILH